jgi:hypothetical protein
MKKQIRFLFLLPFCIFLFFEKSESFSPEYLQIQPRMLPVPTFSGITPSFVRLEKGGPEELVTASGKNLEMIKAAIIVRNGVAVNDISGRIESLRAGQNATSIRIWLKASTAAPVGSVSALRIIYGDNKYLDITSLKIEVVSYSRSEIPKVSSADPPILSLDRNGPIQHIRLNGDGLDKVTATSVVINGNPVSTVITRVEDKSNSWLRLSFRAESPAVPGKYYQLVLYSGDNKVYTPLTIEVSKRIHVSIPGEEFNGIIQKLFANSDNYPFFRAASCEDDSILRIKLEKLPYDFHESFAPYEKIFDQKCERFLTKDASSKLAHCAIRACFRKWRSNDVKGFTNEMDFCISFQINPLDGGPAVVVGSARYSLGGMAYYSTDYQDRALPDGYVYDFRLEYRLSAATSNGAISYTNVTPSINNGTLVWQEESSPYRYFACPDYEKNLLQTYIEQNKSLIIQRLTTFFNSSELRKSLSSELTGLAKSKDPLHIATRVEEVRSGLVFILE